MKQTPAWMIALVLVFLLEGVLGAVQADLITPPPEDPAAAVGSSRNAHPSRNGRLVVFESKAALAPDDHDKSSDVYLFDFSSRSYQRISGADLSRSNAEPSISEDGRTIAFHSYPGSVVKGSQPRTADIFLYHRDANRYELLTNGRHGTSQEAENLCPILNEDGRLVLFTSNAVNLSSPSTLPIRGVYIYDRRSLELDLISRSDIGALANRLSGDAKMSQDGRVVVFKSAATNLARLLPSNSLTFHLYLLDREDRTLVRLDEQPRGFDPEEYIVGQSDMNDAGGLVVFEGLERRVNNPMNTLSHSDLFLFDRGTGMVTKLTEGPYSANSHDPTMSGDGRYIAFVLTGKTVPKLNRGIVVYDREKNEWKQAVAGICQNPVFAKDGQTLVFESDDRTLSPSAKDDVMNLYVVSNPFAN